MTIKKSIQDRYIDIRQNELYLFLIEIDQQGDNDMKQMCKECGKWRGQLGNKCYQEKDWAVTLALSSRFHLWEVQYLFYEEPSWVSRFS